MSYLTHYATRVPSLFHAKPGVRVDEHVLLNQPEFDGGAHIRVFVEDTSPAGRRCLRGAPSPRLKLRIADCSNRVHLDFSVDTPAVRENSLHKIDTLLAALHRFRDGLAAEAELSALRERDRERKEGRCRT